MGSHGAAGWVFFNNQILLLFTGHFLWLLPRTMGVPPPGCSAVAARCILHTVGARTPRSSRKSTPEDVLPRQQHCLQQCPHAVQGPHQGQCLCLLSVLGAHHGGSSHPILPRRSHPAARVGSAETGADLEPEILQLCMREGGNANTLDLIFSQQCLLTFTKLSEWI